MNFGVETRHAASPPTKNPARSGWSALRHQTAA